MDANVRFLAVALSLSLLFAATTAGPTSYHACYQACKSSVAWYFMGGGGVPFAMATIKDFPGASWSCSLVFKLCYTVCAGLVVSPAV